MGGATRTTGPERGKRGGKVLWVDEVNSDTELYGYVRPGQDTIKDGSHIKCEGDSFCTEVHTIVLIPFQLNNSVKIKKVGRPYIKSGPLINNHQYLILVTTRINNVVSYPTTCSLNHSICLCFCFWPCVISGT